MEWWWLIIVFAFIASFVWTCITIFTVTATSDTKKDMVNAISSVVLVNTILVLVLAGIGYFYVQANPAMQQPYVMFMLHLNTLLAIIGVSVSSLYSVSSK